MDVIAQQIQATLAQRPDVTKADVRYRNNVTAPGAATVSVFVKPVGGP